jgi:hypothetical protein
MDSKKADNLKAKLGSQERRLVARSILVPPLKRRRLPVTWPEPPGNVSVEDMEKVWREERENR